MQELYFMPDNFTEKANGIRQAADDVLHFAFKVNGYGDAILPFAVLRQGDCHLPHPAPKGFVS